MKRHRRAPIIIGRVFRGGFHIIIDRRTSAGRKRAGALFSFCTKRREIEIIFARQYIHETFVPFPDGGKKVGKQQNYVLRVSPCAGYSRPFRFIQKQQIVYGFGLRRGGRIGTGKRHVLFFSVNILVNRNFRFATGHRAFYFFEICIVFVRINFAFELYGYGRNAIGVLVLYRRRRTS